MGNGERAFWLPGLPSAVIALALDNRVIQSAGPPAGLSSALLWPLSATTFSHHLCLLMQRSKTFNHIIKHTTDNLEDMSSFCLCVFVCVCYQQLNVLFVLQYLRLDFVWSLLWRLSLSLTGAQVFRPRTPPEAIALCSRLLEYTPTARLTPLEACAHSFFDELRDPNVKLPNGREKPSLFNFTTQGTYAHECPPKHKRRNDPRPLLVHITSRKFIQEFIQTTCSPVLFPFRVIQ